MNRFIKLSLLTLLLFSLSGIETASAGNRFWRTRRSSVIKTWRKPTQKPAFQKTYRPSKQSSQQKWPGAIGAPSPTYKYFLQDVNGYWN